MATWSTRQAYAMLPEAISVDVHAHALVPHYNELLQSLGGTVRGYRSGGAGMPGGDEQARIEAMDDAGVRRQWLSVAFPPYLGIEADAVRAARCINDAHAGLVRNQPDRLGAYAALPLPHIDAALEEMRRCLDELGMVGVALQCACLDQSTAAEQFDPIYAELDRRKGVLFFHPAVNGVCSPLVSEWGLSPTAGAVFEDTTIALHLITRRIPHRFPNIRVIVPHLGGVLPMLLERLDNQMPMTVPDLPEPPSRTARRFYYDTCGHGSLPALRCAVDAFGADQLLPGSDYPVLMPFESYRETLRYIQDAGLPDSAVHKIFQTNITRLTGEA